MKWWQVNSLQTNSHLGQVTPNLVKSLQYEMKDYSEGDLGYLAAIEFNRYLAIKCQNITRFFI